MPDYPALMDPQTMGILSAAFQGLNASGPSRMPVSLGQVIGQGGMAGLGTYMGAMDSQRKNAQTEALIQLEKQKAQQSDLQMQMQLGQINYGRELQGLPPISLGGAGGPVGAPAAGPTLGGGMPPGAAPAFPSGPVAQPQPMQSKFQRDTAGLPPAAVEEAKIALMKGDLTAYGKIIAEGAYKNVQGIGLLKWDPKAGDYTLPASQEAALAARTKAAELAKQDVADAGKQDTYTFGTGLKARPVQTTAAIANALRTGVAPDEETAKKAAQLAFNMGHGVRIGLRGENTDAATGDLGKGYQTPLGQPGTGAVPGEQPSPLEAANIEGRKKFVTARTEGAANYEKGLNEAVVTGQELMSRMQEQKDAMTKFRTGGGGETRAKLAQMAQAANMPAAIVNGIAGGDLGAMQEFNKLAVAGAMKSLQQSMQNLQGTGAGRITQAEFKIFLDANPNLSLDPKAIDKIFQFTEKLYQRSYDEQQGFNKWVKEGNEPADYQAEFAQKMDSEFKRTNLKAIATPTQAGTPKVRRYNPATGKIE